jgi:hypothetical protein
LTIVNGVCELPDGAVVSQDVQKPDTYVAPKEDIVADALTDTIEIPTCPEITGSTFCISGRILDLVTGKVPENLNIYVRAGDPFVLVANPAGIKGNEMKPADIGPGGTFVLKDLQYVASDQQIIIVLSDCSLADTACQPSVHINSTTAIPYFEMGILRNYENVNAYLVTTEDKNKWNTDLGKTTGGADDLISTTNGIYLAMVIDKSLNPVEGATFTPPKADMEFHYFNTDRLTFDDTSTTSENGLILIPNGGIYPNYTASKEGMKFGFVLGGSGAGSITMGYITEK